MKLFLVACTLFLSACSTIRPPESFPLPASLRVKGSLVRITGESFEGAPYFTCTGFAIASRKFMTAAHCLPEHVRGLPYVLKANGHVASPIKINVEKDLAVILVDLDLPSVSFRDEPVAWLEEVWAMGFGHGFQYPVTTHHRLQINKYNLGVDSIYPGNVYEHPFIGGMSGGPIFDRHGRAVGVIQLSSNVIAYGVDVEAIKEFLAE